MTITDPSLIDPPRGNAQRRLVMLARKISEAQTVLLRERDDLLVALNSQGVSQRRLAELVSLGNLQGGGRAFSEPGVQRAVAKTVGNGAH